MNRKGTYQFPFSRFPAVRIAVLLISGVLLGEAFSGGYFLPLGIFGVLVAGLWVLKRVNSQSFFSSVTRFSNTLILLLIIVFGWFRVSIDSMTRENTKTEELVSVMPWEVVNILGVIDSFSSNSIGKIRADIKVLEVDFENFTSHESFNARLLFDDLVNLENGDTISFTGTIIPISEIRNPHQFDYKDYLAQRDIHVQLRSDTIHWIETNTNLLSWSWWQNTSAQIIEKNFRELSRPLAKALLLGYKQDLDQETKKAFSRTGLSHIMAVSGLHVGFIIAPIWWLIPSIRQLKYGQSIGLLVVFFVLFLYAGITGFSTSVMRASITALFLTFGKLYNKSPNSINLTAAASIFLLVLNPRDLFTIGFQLSFSAVFIILLVLPVIQNRFPYWLRLKWYSKPLMVIVVSIVVQLGLYPLQVYYFGEVSVISPISNALFVPLLGVLIPLALLGTLLSSSVDILGQWLSLPLDVFLEWMHHFVTKASNWNWAWFKVESQTWLIFPFWISLVFVITSIRIPEMRWKALIICAFFLSSIQLQTLVRQFQKKPLTITYFDVGQGDAALVQTPNGVNVLIDAGVWSPGNNSGKSVLLPHFDADKIKKLDAVILSHPHADHIGGILELIGSIPIDTIYNSGFEYESNLYASYLTHAEEKGIPIRSLKAGDVLEIDPAVLFLILAPEGRRFNQDPNQHSVILEVIYGETEFLFTGDAGDSQESRILENYSDLLDSDVLKVGHHGSRTSSGYELMATTTPDISVISLAERNRFNHPHSEAIQRILNTDTQLLFTSRDKAIILKSNGRNIWQEEWD